jgi:hypothetical protein
MKGPINPIKKLIEEKNVSIEVLSVRSDLDMKTLVRLTGSAPSNPLNRPGSYKKVFDALDIPEKERDQYIDAVITFLGEKGLLVEKAANKTLRRTVIQKCGKLFKSTFKSSLGHNTDKTLTIKTYSVLFMAMLVYMCKTKDTHKKFKLQIMPFFEKAMFDKTLTCKDFLHKYIKKETEKTIICKPLDRIIEDALRVTIDTTASSLQSSFINFIKTHVKLISFTEGRDKFDIKFMDGTHIRVPFINEGDSRFHEKLLQKRFDDKLKKKLKNNLIDFFEANSKKMDKKYINGVMSILKNLKKNKPELLTVLTLEVDRYKKTIGK